MDDSQVNHTIGEIRKELNISYTKARDLVRNEPDVLVFGDKRKMRRIPHQVYLRILRRAANPSLSSSRQGDHLAPPRLTGTR